MEGSIPLLPSPFKTKAAVGTDPALRGWEQGLGLAGSLPGAHQISKHSLVLTLLAQQAGS